MSRFTVLFHRVIHKLGITWGDLGLKHVKSLFHIIGILFLVALQGGTAESFEVRDDLGSSVAFDAPAARIVSLYAGHTENLIAIGAKGKLVAVSQADDAKITGSLPRLGIKPGIASHKRQKQENAETGQRQADTGGRHSANAQTLLFHHFGRFRHFVSFLPI